MPAPLFSSVIFSLSRESGANAGMEPNIPYVEFCLKIFHIQALSVGKFFIKYLTSFFASCRGWECWLLIARLMDDPSRPRVKTADFHRFYQFMARTEIEQSFESVTHQSHIPPKKGS